MTSCPSPPSNQVFLSYSRNDLVAANELRAALEQSGLIVFKDDDSIHSGDRWLTRLQEALQACSAFVVLLGRDGVQRWMGAELQVALSRNLSPHGDAARLPIFPVLLHDTSPETLPPFLALFQATKWSSATPVPNAFIDAVRALHAEESAIKDCPFLGLSPFAAKDAHLFFGRRAEVLEALAGVGDQQQTSPAQIQSAAHGYTRWLQIEGNSGAGKSSLVQAGMLPMIERDALWARTGIEHWTILGPMMPGTRPLDMLMEKLAHACDREMHHVRDCLAGPGETVLADWLRSRKRDNNAFLLVIDQFEELFTFSEDAQRKRFDQLLAQALGDPDCPLFLISTVRADFLDRFETLPRLAEIYNSRCKRYFLPTISERGLREIIDEPARLAGLDVREVRAAILTEASDLAGALPLVENALHRLWEQRASGTPEAQGGTLSGDTLRESGGIAGMLSTEADQLLSHIEQTVPGGRMRALELLLSLTRINEDGRHSRRRIHREEAIASAGGGPAADHALRLLAGERPADSPNARGALRLITTTVENDAPYVDLIHETLVRPKQMDPTTGKREGYWPTLYDYVEGNRDRDIHRQQLAFQFAQWRASRHLGRWRNLAGWRDLRLYRRLHIDQQSAEGRFLLWSRRAGWTEVITVMLVVGIFAESFFWANFNGLPPIYALYHLAWLLGYQQLPEMVEIPPGHFLIDCKVNPDGANGIPCENGTLKVELKRPYALGKYEVSVLEYDYSVWDRQQEGELIDFPPHAKNRIRPNQPMTDVSWSEAKDYASWLSDKASQKKTGEEVRLPTSVEWEYAAIAGRDDSNPLLWAEADKDGFCSAETSMNANPWNLVGMLGSVREWVLDDWDPSLSGASNYHSDKVRLRSREGFPWYCEGAVRFDGIPSERKPDVGFRVLRGAPVEASQVELEIQDERKP